MVFLMLKNQRVFNLPIFKILERNFFCIVFKHSFFVTIAQKRKKMGAPNLSPKFITFFPFPQAFFSTVSTFLPSEKVLHNPFSNFHTLSLF